MQTRSLSAICAGLMLAVFVVGCQQMRHSDQSVDTLAVGPNLVELTAPADPMSTAADAAGGLTQWAAAKKLELDCVVTVYRPDGSLYLTEHTYDIYPWSKAIRITAQEPLGRVVAEYVGGKFSVIEGGATVDVSQMSLSRRDLAEAVLKIVTAPIGFWDKSAGFSVQVQPMRVGPVWYRPIEQIDRVLPTAEGKASTSPYWSRVVLLQNQESSLVEIVWFCDVGTQKFLAVRGYDYAKLSGPGILVPHKIEVFRADAQFGLRERFVQIDLE